MLKSEGYAYVVSILLLRLNRETKDDFPVNLIPALACGIVQLLMA